MCLDKVDKVTKEGRGYGYKTFKKDGGNLRPICVRRSEVIFPLEKWFADPNNGEIANKYPAGFHINRYKKHAISWGYLDGTDTCRKVFYRDVVVSGLFYGITAERVIVARQIYITKEEIK